jgi:hypothetical protein
MSSLAYVLGQIFAEFERQGVPKYSEIALCQVRPAAYFPMLFTRLHQRGLDDTRIAELMQKVPASGFPETFTRPEQAEFELGRLSLDVDQSGN